MGPGWWPLDRWFCRVEDQWTVMWTPRVLAVDVCPQRSRNRPKQVRLFSSRVYDIWSYSSKSIYLTSHVLHVASPVPSFPKIDFQSRRNPRNPPA